MKLISWDSLPDCMKNDSVKEYYEVLAKKQKSLVIKRIFDIICAFLIFIILLPVLIIISVIIKIDSKGPVLFRQIRVTQYGKQFSIFKFRTMVKNAERIGTQVTTKNDNRVTKIGKILRKYRLDEVPQLFNIITGDMSFVGTRPEVVKYVKKYSDEMMATLLLPAGVTSEASIQYKDEELLLANAKDADNVYLNEVLTEKMKYNLKSIKDFSFFNDIKTMIKTVIRVFNRDKNIQNKAIAKNRGVNI